MKLKILISTIITALFFSTASFAGGVATHSEQSINHSGQAVAHTMVAGVKSVAAVTAVPLMAVGKIGDVAGNSGEYLFESANQPLEISEQTFTAGPAPDQML